MSLSLLDQVSAISNEEKLKVFITTWNMGNAEAEGFNNIFTEKDWDNYDIFAIGLQESTYILDSNKTADPIAHLRLNLEKFFISKNFYVVEHCYRAQLQLYVFARKSLEKRITNIEKCVENTGFLHVFPNKGGLLITFHVDATKLAFVSCHLAAHEGIKHCEDRNASIIEILGGVRAGDKTYDITEQFHHVWWMGDMNYRLTYDKKVPKSVRKNCVGYSSDKSSADAADVNDVTVGLKDRSVEDLESDPDSEDDPEYDDEEGDLLASKKTTSPTATESLKTKSSKKVTTSDKSKKKELARKNRNRTLDLICKEDFETMMEFDELNREIASGRILNGFVALQPDFFPTFKRTRQLIIKDDVQLCLPDGVAAEVNADRSLLSSAPSKRTPAAVENSLNELGSSVHGTKQSAFNKFAIKNHKQYTGTAAVEDFYNDKRMPSFCDRILYKSLPCFKDNIQPIFFDSCESARSSDHKPVRSGFEVGLTKGAEGILINEQLVKPRSDAKGLKSPSSTANMPSPTAKGGRPKSFNYKQGGDASELNVVEIIISNLKGFNLEEMDSQMFGGGSDPYIVITTDPACLLLSKNTGRNAQKRFQFTPEHAGLTTSVVKHDCNPTWKEKFDFYLASNDFVGLSKNASFIFSVWDHDTYNADDLIGVFTIPFREIIKAHCKGDSFHFNEDLHSNSEIMGKITGQIDIGGGVSQIHDMFLESKVLGENYISLADARDYVIKNGINEPPKGCCVIN